MIPTIQILVLLLVVVAVAAFIASQLKVPPAILLVLTGAALALVPGLPTMELAATVALRHHERANGEGYSGLDRHSNVDLFLFAATTVGASRLLTLVGLSTPIFNSRRATTQFVRFGIVSPSVSR